MKFKAIIHDADEGGFWAEVPAIPGCVTQAETMDELVANLKEAIEACLSVPAPDAAVIGDNDVNARILEIAV
jgi:predicted RNase H-like HicB family nuclease